MGIREGSAEVTIGEEVDAAFAWLADPRNAGAWFANVALPEPPERPLRAGATFRFTLIRQRGRSIPMRLAEYQPPQRFTWETTYPSWRDNLAWSVVLTPDANLATPLATPGARLRMTISQRPGPLGWPSLLLAAALGRIGLVASAGMDARAARAAQQAAEALAATPTLTYSPYDRHGKPAPSKRRKRRH